MSEIPHLSSEQIRNGARILRGLIREVQDVMCPNFSLYRDRQYLSFRFHARNIFHNLIPIQYRAFKIAQKLLGSSTELTSLLENYFHESNFNYRKYHESWESRPYPPNDPNEREQWYALREVEFQEQWYKDKEYFINLLKETLDEIETSRPEERGAKMAKTEVRLGDGTIIYGDLVTADSIKNSFNRVADSEISAELKNMLSALAKAVAKMAEKMPPEEAQQVTRDLEVLTSESISKAPRKQWIQLSADGLKQAARNIGEIGKPVLELVGTILPLLIPKT